MRGSGGRAKVRCVRLRVKDETFMDLRKVEERPSPSIPSIGFYVLFESKKVRFHARILAPPQMLKISLAYIPETY
jgi:hypothetical protein